MTVRDLCIALENNAEITLYRNSKPVFAGPAYMVFHEPNPELDTDLVYWESNILRSDELLDMKVTNIFVGVEALAIDAE